MTKKKFFAAVTAASCMVSSFAFMPQFSGQTFASEIVSNDFEVNYDGWHGTDTDVEFYAKQNAGFGGSRGMIVAGRSTSDEGAASSKGLYLWGGEKYDYSVKVYSEKDEMFHVTLRCVDMDTDEETLVNLADKAVKGGEWTELSASYKAPKNSSEFEIVITTDSTDDFAIDDFTVTGREHLTANAAELGLKDEFADYFRVGNIFNGGTIKNSAIQAIILKDHNAIECENETKPDATIVQNGSTNTNVKVSLNSAAAIIDFCVQNNIGFRGHTLVWHSQTPDWFFKENFSKDGAVVNASTMDQRMESYIKNMFELYRTQYPDLDLYAYDVCNECISDAGNGGPRGRGFGNGNSPWVEVYGDNSFIEKAFTYAREYAPASCKLFYNDYNEFAGGKKSSIINSILKPLKAKGVLDGMGMQSHIDCSANQGWGCTKDYLAAMDEYLSLGIEVQVTELDVSRDNNKYTDAEQAAKYKAIFQHCVDVNKSGQYEKGVTLVQVWGPNDTNSWVRIKDRDENKPNYPLLYDGSNPPKAKPAYNAITSIIPQSEWGIGVPYKGSNIVPVQIPDEDGNYFHSTFESSTDGWSGRAATAETSGSQHFEGSKSLFVSGRESAWNGTQHALSSTYFKPGEEYSFSVNVMHTSADSADPVHYMMKIQYKVGDEANYAEVASGDAPADQWLQLSNTNYTIPADATDVQIYVETEDTINNFYIDDMYASVPGTTHSGAGQPKVKKVIPGDLNFDGVCSAFDMPLARKYAPTGEFEDAMMKKAADVDGSGKYEVNDLVLISEFLLGKITEFPKAAKAVDFDALEATFKGVTIADSWKKAGENNPLTTQRFGADPGWMVYGDRLYIYTTNDAFEPYGDGRYQINTYNSGTINCISSADLVNWTDHGAIPVAGRDGFGGPAKWASRAWAPDAAWKNIDGKDKFFLYFANNGSGVGVLTSDSPTGPWTDPIGKELANSSVPGGQGVLWQFDPGVYYDPETDEGYIAYGGGVPQGKDSNPGTGRIGKLGKDMISIDGSFKTMETPYLFEDSSLIKIGDTWYYSYCTNWAGGGTVNGVRFGSADICYMTSKNPMDTWTASNLKGVVFGNTGSQRIDNGGNNHHSIIYFKGKYYVAYHSRQQALRMGMTFINKDHPNDRSKDSTDGNYRSTQLNEASFNPSTGQITCSGDMKGVSQIEALDPYTTVQAETMSNQSKGIKVNGLGDTTVAMKKGEWIKVSGADLSKGVDQITAKGKGTGVIKVCAGSTTGTVIGYIDLDGSGDEVTLAAKESVSGNKDIYLIASADVELDYWYFS